MAEQILGETGTLALGEVPDSSEASEVSDRTAGRRLVRNPRTGGWTYANVKKNTPAPEPEPVEEVLDYRFPEAPVIEYAGERYTPAQLMEATGQRYDLVMAARQAVADLALSNALHDEYMQQQDADFGD